MRRSVDDIAADILRVAVNGASRSDIICEANVNSNLAHRYLEILKDNNLIVQENRLFITTDKGKTYQKIARELKL